MDWWMWLIIVGVPCFIGAVIEQRLSSIDGHLYRLVEIAETWENST